jgi:hypothetical protein
VRHDWSISEEFFGYDAAEYAAWTSNEADVSRKAVAARLAQCGDLGKDETTYFNQAPTRFGGQHFPEVVFGCHLIASGLPRGGVFYENYLLSWRTFERMLPGAGSSVRATERLLEVLSPAFFRAFDVLCDKNPKLVDQKGQDRMSVDLAAIHPGQRRLGFYEMKKYKPRAPKPEPIQEQQLFVLAAVRHILDKLGKDAFRDEPFEVETKLVAFVSTQDLRLARISIPQRHTLSFSA